MISRDIKKHNIGRAGYTNILEAYAKIREPEKVETQTQEKTHEMPEFSVTVTPFEREGSNIKGLARIYFENSFIVRLFRGECG